jgi:hypothetical protein
MARFICSWVNALNMYVYVKAGNEGNTPTLPSQYETVTNMSLRFSPISRYTTQHLIRISVSH